MLSFAGEGLQAVSKSLLQSFLKVGGKPLPLKYVLWSHWELVGNPGILCELWETDTAAFFISPEIYKEASSLWAGA